MKQVSTQNITKTKGLKPFQSINDLRELEYNNELETKQRLALKNFDRYRISELNSQISEENFHKKYMQLQVMANLSPFEEFLKEDYYF